VLNLALGLALKLKLDRVGSEGLVQGAERGLALELLRPDLLVRLSQGGSDRSNALNLNAAEIAILTKIGGLRASCALFTILIPKGMWAIFA
jgi:hypothetical protein